MASPRLISKFQSLSPVPNLRSNIIYRNSLTPRSFKTNNNYVKSPENKNRLSPFNVNTPNRKEILLNGLPNKQRTVLGSGGFGTVYKALYKGNQVAAKILKKSKNSDNTINSEKHAYFLRHANIVNILSIEEGAALSLITMELCGITLQDQLEKKCLDRKERINIWRDIACALQFCHNAGVVHADVKPKNILIGNCGQPKLTDFGSSVLISNVHTEQTSHIMTSTPGYAAPEVLCGIIPSPAADIYSLGILAWQILSRKIPFEGLHVHTIIYLSVKGKRPSDEDLDDEFQGQYKSLYREMWSQKMTARPVASKVIYMLDILMNK
ncbi:serine/threonine-protein kinase mos [Vespula pensylvanica]|uniref:serine/threonine-protein kinase mos n=1 Tax=Vespula pensylvanica TaxID=30213 RepID=UPI001CBA36A4|nr:serine/threonine-protein kinase mos [Vespula pensylvanica]